MDHYNVFRTIITWTMVAVMLPWSYFVFDGTTEQRFYDTAGNVQDHAGQGDAPPCPVLEQVRNAGE